mgnify:CR=1 FL=1
MASRLLRVHCPIRGLPPDKGHAEIFRENYRRMHGSNQLCNLTMQAIMVIEMSESIVMRYLKHAIIDMYENNRTEVLCPCRRCK